MTGSSALSLQHEALCCLADVCVWGADCLGAKDDGSASGICTPIVKGTASSVQVRLVPSKPCSLQYLCAYRTPGSGMLCGDTCFVLLLLQQARQFMHLP